MSDALTTEELPIVEERPRAPIEFRSAPAGDVEVDIGKRTVEHVIVPYNFDGVAEYPIGSGRRVLETVMPGAFDGVERRANRVKVNRDHDYARSCGKVITLYPSRVEGLVGVSRFTPHSDLADETLALIDDGVLEPSIGMAVLPSWQEMTDNRSRRVVHKAFLDHVGWVPNPAYEGGVPVLDMRQIAPPPAPVETPNLDEVLAWMRAGR